MEKYIKFKKILEYFIAHLEHLNNKSTKTRGYDKYIKPLTENNNKFKETGKGWNGDKIQAQVSDWENYNGHILCINIGCNYGSYKTKACYLNWIETWLNVKPIWNRDYIEKLYISKEENTNAREELTFTTKELGLFDNSNDVNDNLKEFFNKYEGLIIEYKNNKSMQEYVNLLKANKNIILTGAPGTGKTYLAKEIAKQLGASEVNKQCIMVQFHPSYDYTDFVEGLRPVQNSDETTIGFELKRGVFKDFCATALENLLNSKKEQEEINNEEIFKKAYYKFINDINDIQIKDIKLRSGNATMDIVSVTNNNNIILKAHGSNTKRRYIISYNRLKKLTQRYKNKVELESIQNIYDAITDVIGGCNSSAYWATLYLIFEKYLTEDINIEPQHTELKNYVFIIDEINRGEISKIFGELFYSIDPGYRGEKGLIKTQYQNLIEEGDIYNDGFYIPENVYIIGTMNDIDRSVDSMDFAMRRRFAWKEIKATDRTEMLNDLGEEVKKIAIDKMISINKAIEETDGLNSSYHIGPAYFKKIEQYSDNPDSMWDKLWEYHIKGLLNEYIRGSENIENKISKFEEAYNNPK